MAKIQEGLADVHDNLGNVQKWFAKHHQRGINNLLTKVFDKIKTWSKKSWEVSSAASHSTTRYTYAAEQLNKTTFLNTTHLPPKCFSTVKRCPTVSVIWHGGFWVWKCGKGYIESISFFLYSLCVRIFAPFVTFCYNKFPEQTLEGKEWTLYVCQWVLLLCCVLISFLPTSLWLVHSVNVRSDEHTPVWIMKRFGSRSKSCMGSSESSLTDESNNE